VPVHDLELNFLLQNNEWWLPMEFAWKQFILRFFILTIVIDGKWQNIFQVDYLFPKIKRIKHNTLPLLVAQNSTNRFQRLRKEALSFETIDQASKQVKTR